MPPLPDRPILWRSQVVCAKCQKPVERLSSTGLHSSNGGLPTGEGYIMAEADCHGDYCDVFVPFSAVREKPDVEVLVFSGPGRLFAPLGGPDLYNPETGRAVCLNGRPCGPDAPRLGESKRLANGSVFSQTPANPSLLCYQPKNHP